LGEGSEGPGLGMDGIAAMSNKELFSFLKWIRDKEFLAPSDFVKFERHVAEALWEVPPKVVADRLGRIVGELLDFLVIDLPKATDQSAAEKTGSGLMWELFLLATNLSPGEVRVRQRTKEGAPCVLVLGFAGSHVEQMTAQVDFYVSLGFSTICSTMSVWPHAFAMKQATDIGEALNTALMGGEKLLLHMCSGHGVSFWSELATLWEAASEPPFSKLPPLASCLKGFVYECGPWPIVNPQTGEVPDDPGFGVVRVLEEVVTSDEHNSQLVFSLLGTIGGLCARFDPTFNMHEEASKKPYLMKYLRGALRMGAFWFAPEHGHELPHGYKGLHLGTVWTGHVPWESIELRMGIPLPRLFLYTTRDIVILPKFVEAYIRYTKKYRPDASVHVQKCTLSPHCKLWDDQEKEACVEAVTNFLKAACLL